MVLSLLNSKINYVENKNVEPDDITHEASVYELTFHSNEIVISIGKEKYTYIDDDIIYFPIYLIVDESVQDQIGVFEVKSDRLPFLLDDDGDVDLEKMNDPLFYSFVTDSYLESFSKESPPQTDDDDDDSILPSKSSSIDDDDDDDDEDDDDEDDDYENKPKEPNEPGLGIFEKINETENELLKEETKEDAEKNRVDVPSKSLWIQKYMKNLHYDIIDNEGGGDCLFAVVRDAFAFLGKITSVARLRAILVNDINANPLIFDNYREQYDMISQSILDDEKKLKHYMTDHNNLKEKLKTEKAHDVRAAIVDQQKQIKQSFDILKKQRHVSKLMLNEYRFMKGVKDIESFKRKIASCEFWGETWAISTLEKTLNIKLILLSKESYLAKDLHNVLNCGQMNDTEIEKKGVFEPDYYIIADYNGSHYKLITYKGKAALTFQEIPFDIKMKITDKCLERNSGAYSYIPDFQSFKELYVKPGKISPELEEENVEMPTELYDPTVAFQFYIKSNDKPLPGKGSGETFPAKLQYGKKSAIPDEYNFIKLHTFEHWRRKLSHFYEIEFSLDEKKWQSVEHYYQAQKFKERFPSFYHEFTLNSNSDLSQDVAMAKAATSKSGKYKKERVRPLNVEVDPNIEKHKSEILQKAIFAKFTQNPEFKTILLETKNAKLLHYVQKDKALLANDIMVVRHKIKSNK